MPIGDVAAGILEVIGRIIGQIFIEVILELLIKGPGYLILKIIKGNKIDELDPDDGLVILTGILFWVFVALIVFVGLRVL